MTFSELIDSIRSSYVDVLAKRIDSYETFQREAVLRRSDGAPALDGGTPLRVDAIGSDGTSLMVDATSQLRFDEFSFGLNGAAVCVAPFSWDRLAVEVSGAIPHADAVFQEWFMRWFDDDDERPPGNDGLRGVVHFLSKLQAIDDGVAVQIDLGSCPGEAIDDLLFALAEAGAKEVRLSA